MATCPGFETLADVSTHGVTVGLGTIRELSHQVALIAHGEGKRRSIQRILAAERFDPSWPATMIWHCRRPSLWVTSDTID